MTMRFSETFWLRILIFLPLLIPALAELSIAVGFDKTLLGAILISSGFIGGPPYIIFALLLIVFLWKKEAKIYYQVASFAPLLFIPFLALYILLFEVLGRTTWSPSDIIYSFVIAGVFCVPIGYLYVGLLFFTKRFIFKSADST